MSHNLDRGKIKNKTSIDERPEVVDEKERVGDWEADTIVGKNHKGALVTDVERKSKYSLIEHVKRKTADGVVEEQIRGLKPHMGKVLTITADNGTEFARHEKLSEELEADVYFAHPYSSWERGVNENTNGLIRQYFPKGMELLDPEMSDSPAYEPRLIRDYGVKSSLTSSKLIIWDSFPTISFGREFG